VADQNIAGGDAGGETMPPPLTGGNQGKTSRRKPRQNGSKFMIVPGTRIEKGYPLTRDELWLLGSLGIGATTAFAGASGLIGYYFNVGMNLALSQGVPEKMIAYYESSRQWSLIGAVALCILGLILAAGSGLKVFSIIRRTTHDE